MQACECIIKSMKHYRLIQHKINYPSIEQFACFGTTWNSVTRFIRTITVCLLMSLYSQLALSASAQLVMVEESDCPYCERFNAEIAPAYPNTTEGKAAPLRRVNIENGWPADLSHIKTETLTPTFILIQNNQELGRLHGYQGDEFFWFLLGELFEKLVPSTVKTK